MAEFAFAFGDGLDLGILGEQFVYDQALVWAHGVHLDIVAEKPRPLCEHTCTLAHFLHLLFVVSIHIYKKTCCILAMLLLHESAHNRVNGAQMITVGADEDFRLFGGDCHQCTMAGRDRYFINLHSK